MIKTAMLSVSSSRLIFGGATHYVKFYDISYTDLKYTSTELTILLYEQLRGPLQYLCDKIFPYIEREKL